MTCRFDHLVFGVASLPEGIDAFHRRSGCRLPFGGTHPLMGTHNALTRVNKGGFIELIAIDPEAPSPQRARWFSLDDPATRERLAIGPSLLTWVVSVPDIDAAIESVRGTGIDPGRAVEQRRGDLAWRITVRDDGALIENGTFPALIQWPTGVDATARMQDVGLDIVTLRVTHPEPDRLGQAFASIGAGELAALEPGPVALRVTLAGATDVSSDWSSDGARDGSSNGSSDGSSDRASDGSSA